MKRAFTLIELLVYMVLIGFIIVVAGRVFSDSTSMRIRSQNMLKASEVVGSVSNILREDISQMGTKFWGQTVGTDYKVGEYASNVYWNANGNDRSSYRLFRRSQGDSLVFKKAEFDADGKFIAVRQISWAANIATGKLVRSCETMPTTCAANCGTDDPSACPAQVVIAENIKKFELTPSKPGKDGNTQGITIFPPNTVPGFKLLAKTTGVGIVPITPYNTGTETTVEDFAKNSTGTGHNQLYLARNIDPDPTNCEPLNFLKDETYAIEFKMPFPLKNATTREDSVSYYESTQFVPGKDHLAIGLRDYITGNKIEGAPNDILFYPPQSEEASELARHFEFSVSEDIPIASNACIAITFAFYSPQANRGKLHFSDFKVLRKTDKSFYFPSLSEENPHGISVGTADNAEKIAEKESVKAFELKLEIDYKGEKLGTFSSEEKGMVIATPNNGVIVEE